VIAPALATDSGLTRLHGLCEAFLSYIERGGIPGGCFFASAIAEFDCKAPGAVRSRITQCQDQWMDTLERAAWDAQAKGELPAGNDPQQLAFELEGALLTANWYFHLYTDVAYLDRARRAVPRPSGQRSHPGRLARPARQPGRPVRIPAHAKQNVQL
jgi:hypothetical protein